MKTDLYSRMFSRLEDLIPGLASISLAGSTYYAPPRNAEDMAMVCSVCACHDDELELELAKDVVIDGVEHCMQWMKFNVDRAKRTACLIAIQTGTCYESVHGETIYPQARSLPLNSFAVNWLGILVNLQFGFREVMPATSIN